MTDSLAGIAGHSTPGPVSPGFERGEKLRAQLVRATKKRPGRRPDLIREFVCKGPPAFHEDDRWDYDQLCDWAYNVYDYFHARAEGADGKRIPPPPNRNRCPRNRGNSSSQCGCIAFRTAHSPC